MLERRNARLRFVVLFTSGTGAQELIGAVGQPLNDSAHLRRRLALAINDFREPPAQAAVMVDCGKSEVFEGKRTDSRERVIDALLTLCYPL